MSAKRVVILSGPSCVGKGPLVAALNQFYPELKYAQIPVIKSRESKANGPKPEEIAIWEDSNFFRSNKLIKALRSDPSHRYLVGKCRKWYQAVDLEKVKSVDAERIFIEIYHTLGVELIKNCFLKSDVQVTTIFLSPLGMQEIGDIKKSRISFKGYLTAMMFQKQLYRARYQNMKIDSLFINDVFRRARDAYDELISACSYSHVIVNHDGEGNPNWHRLPTGEFTARPEGDAGRALTTLAAILSGSATPNTENWRSLKLR